MEINIVALRAAAVKSQQLSAITKYQKGLEAKKEFMEMLSEELIISLIDQIEILQIEAMLSEVKS